MRIAAAAVIENPMILSFRVVFSLIIVNAAPATSRSINGNCLIKKAITIKLKKTAALKRSVRNLDNTSADVKSPFSEITTLQIP